MPELITKDYIEKLRISITEDDIKKFIKDKVEFFLFTADETEETHLIEISQ